MRSRIASTLAPFFGLEVAGVLAERLGELAGACGGSRCELAISARAARPTLGDRPPRSTRDAVGVAV